MDKQAEKGIRKTTPFKVVPNNFTYLNVTNQASERSVRQELQASEEVKTRSQKIDRPLLLIDWQD